MPSGASGRVLSRAWWRSAAATPVMRSVGGKLKIVADFGDETCVLG